MEPANLENLARTYWRFLSRVTLGLVRVVYGEDERSVRAARRPFTLLRFDTPEYVVEPDHGKVTLADPRRAARRPGRARLRVPRPRRAPRAEPDGTGAGELHIEVEVANFYPSIAAGFSIPVYEVTQSSIHVLVTHAFLRSLATLELAESKVGSAWRQATRRPGRCASEAGRRLSRSARR